MTVAFTFSWQLRPVVKATETGEGAFPAAAAKRDALQFVGGGMRRTIIAGDAEQQQQRQQQEQRVAREQRLHERPRGRTPSFVRAAQWLHSACGKRSLRLLFIEAAATEWEGGGGGTACSGLPAPPPLVIHMLQLLQFVTARR